MNIEDFCKKYNITDIIIPVITKEKLWELRSQLPITTMIHTYVIEEKNED